MAITKIVVTGAMGTGIEETIQAMIEMTERYNCTVEAELNGTLVKIGPSRVHDVMRIWQFLQDSKKSDVDE